MKKDRRLSSHTFEFERRETQIVLRDVAFNEVKAVSVSVRLRRDACDFFARIG